MKIHFKGSGILLSVLMLGMTALSNAQAVERPQLIQARINDVVAKVMQEKHIPGLTGLQNTQTHAKLEILVAVRFAS